MPREDFEEQGKLAFQANPRGTRLFIKTRGKRIKKTQGAQVVARVTTTRPGSTPPQRGQWAYNVADVSTITRLLRFAMQQALGPMHAVTAAAIPAAPVAAATAVPPPVPAASKKKKKGKKH